MSDIDVEMKTWTRADFIWFLENTLIPDLKESGLHSTAEDFETAVYFMTGEDAYFPDTDARYIEYPHVRVFPRRTDI